MAVFSGRSRRANAFFRFVMHPGAPAKPFMAPALEVGRSVMLTRLPLALAKAPLDRADLEKRISKVVRQAAFAAQAAAQRLAPADTGRLRSSINVNMVTPILATVGTNVEYARAVEFGSKPHLIRPKQARMLAFYWPKLPPRVKKRTSRAQGA
jgi:phage gpG-like protein